MRNVDFALIVVFLFHSVVRSCKKRKENYLHIEHSVYQVEK